MLCAFSCVALSSAFRSRQDSFPTDVWETVTEVTCDQLQERAQERMGKYRGQCGVGPDDMDSGAVEFALLRSGASKLCKCSAVDVDELRKDMKDIEDQECSDGIFGPTGEMDRIYSDCKSGTLNLGEFKLGDDKLTEAKEEQSDEEEAEPAPPVKATPKITKSSTVRREWEFSGPIKFTQVGGSTGIGGSAEFCLSVTDYKIGAEVYGAACSNGNINQVWYYNMQGNGRLQVGEQLLCLEERGTELHLAECDLGNAQDFSWMSGPKGARMIKNKGSHKCFGLRYSTDLGSGKKVTSWACQKGVNQGVQLCNKASKAGCDGYVW